jgi:hypothetical protein
MSIAAFCRIYDENLGAKSRAEIYGKLAICPEKSIFKVGAIGRYSVKEIVANKKKPSTVHQNSRKDALRASQK